MKKVRVLLLMALLSVMTLSLTSCEDDEHYYGSVVGVWELESDDYGIVPEIDIDKYAFYPDGTGVYGCYDNRGVWISDIPFLWSYGQDPAPSASTSAGQTSIITTTTSTALT